MKPLFYAFLVLFSLTCLTSHSVGAQTDEPQEEDSALPEEKPAPGQIPGYLSDISSERDSRFYEVVFSPPQATKAPKLSEVIFNAQLSAEFKRKYREQFGQLDSESVVYQPSLFKNFDQNHGNDQQQEADQLARENFAKYMERRLIEWHADNYMKTDPAMRPVYETKEKLSNVHVQVAPKTKLNLRYNMSDNTADFILENPYLELAKINIQMDRASMLPTAPQEEKLMLQKQITKAYRFNETVFSVDGIMTEELVRTWRYGWSSSISTTAAYKTGGFSSRETRYNINVARSF